MPSGRKGVSMVRSGLSPKPAFRAVAAASLLAGGITLLLLAAVYALRGIWPFGGDNVAYVDTAQFYLPDYYKLWDALHGADWNINWFSGLIQGGNATWFEYTDPGILAFLLVSRDHVLEGLSLYLAIWLFLIALIAAAAVSLRFPSLPLLWRSMLALAYTFSGFVLQYYSNFSWLKVVAAFPLLLLSLELLWREGRYLLYFLVFAWYLYISIYFSFMISMYVLLFSAGYCLFILPRELRGDRCLRLALSTVAAFGITARSWMSSSSSLAGTSRFQSNLDSGLMAGFTTWNIPNTRHTVLMLLGMAFVFALVIRALLRQRLLSPEEALCRRKAIRFFAFLLGALAVPMAFTNIDTAFHFGQYNFFPMRYGFVIPATLLAAAGLCLEEELSPAAPPPDKKAPWLPATAAVILTAALVFFVPKLWPVWQSYGACFLTVLGKEGYREYFGLLVFCGLMFFGLYLALLHLKSRRVIPILMAAVLLLQLGSNAYGLLAAEDNHTYTREYDPAYVETSDSLYAYFSEQDISPLARFKNVDNSLSASYPALAGVSSMASVYSSNSALRLGIFQELGYTINYFRILDAGGTVFTDMLFGVQNILSAEEPDASLYTDTGITVDGIRIGTSNYPGRIGLAYADGALDGYLDLLTLPDRLNCLYEAFTGSKEPLACTPDAVLTSQGEGLKTCTVTCSLEEASLLYLAADGMLMNISAGGKPVTVPTYQNTKNIAYPAAFNSNLLYLGSFDAGEAVITFMSSSPITEDSLTLVALEQDKLSSFYADARYDPATTVTTGENSISISLTAERGGENLFLPVCYSSRWDCTLNGEDVTPEAVMGIFLSIPLQEGENNIHLVRGPYPPSFTAGKAITLLSAVLVLLWLLARRRISAFRLPPSVYSAATVLFYLVCGAAAAFLYLVPAISLILQGTIVRF